LWYQNKTTERVSFGANQVPVPNKQGEELFSVALLQNKGKIGPLIGIMTSLAEKGKVIGNVSFFKALQLEAVDHHGVTVVFPPEGIKNGKVSGFMFIPEKEAWYPVITPLPNVVYNRVPLRKTEKSLAFKQAKDVFTEWKIPFFNPAYIDKNGLFELFNQHSFFQRLLPETIKVSEKQRLNEFLLKHKGIYLKPALSSRGSGIFLLRIDIDGRIQFKSHSIKKIYPSFERFWEDYSLSMLTKGYIAQVEVNPDLLDGNRYDFRIHAHDSINGYEITGIGVRQSQKQNLTTHIPNGGRLIPYERVRTDKHDRFFSHLVQKVGQVLSKELGYFGEFSIDAGLTATGEYVLYEVNSKPMEFDEKKIERKRVEKLTNLLFRKAGFHS
jgi:hypothetical protein